MTKKILIKALLKRLDFVMWDRYTGDDDNLAFFGWIDREDSHKDFVVLDFSIEPTWFMTSSKKYSKKISEILNQEHNDCKRVEELFDFENIIKTGEKNVK